MKRWLVRIVDIEGEVIDERAYLLRRTAVKYARWLASPFYDVVLARSDGSDTRILHAHVVPEELLRQMREEQE